ncbi:hypothetical protein IMZ38_01680 [Thermosphaera chiliense]|uniref:Uncharacterized protein n=1 Tax=Thermosphaera chiliense TaxID=3402707 RepID=A0A7M1UTT9_9CREN|nr:hypothetical protein [Thermosphaera aggregans]QOR94672.1 hypothetical protein IMZ38_01680 [Thermosphaera aggregans]
MDTADTRSMKTTRLQRVQGFQYVNAEASTTDKSTDTSKPVITLLELEETSKTLGAWNLLELINPLRGRGVKRIGKPWVCRIFKQVDKL